MADAMQVFNQIFTGISQFAAPIVGGIGGILAQENAQAIEQCRNQYAGTNMQPGHIDSICNAQYDNTGQMLTQISYGLSRAQLIAQAGQGGSPEAPPPYQALPYPTQRPGMNLSLPLLGAGLVVVVLLMRK